MPGFNQQGPMNQGPMTGGGRGTCANGQMAGAAGFGNARFAGPGSGFRGGRGGRSFGRGPGCGRWYSQVPVTASAPVTKQVLQQRADILESELNAIKEQLASLSDS
ncbi:DUF5320 domain-containing protein [Desulfobacula phenolica]|uniref:DUF5320 domain-containing protein n=1 Tax=Desulfobacula phenolica TaxID=90732 RepID=A0A1H2JKQ9_9BACT|nr:DUF5320 domain-containing protein [Desulfobacula phenolica]SDU56947.1 hypothetical protein SAMN04487931_11352 [Desulfobacula phenolica]